MEVRINKFLSEAGVCSRREADRQIEAGNVTIGGKTARMGDQVSDGQEVCFCGRPVQKEKEMILIALNNNPIKERDYVKSTKKVVENFKNKLEKYGINVTIRREMGADIDGACGQLRKSFIDKSNEQP